MEKRVQDIISVFPIKTPGVYTSPELSVRYDMVVKTSPYDKLNTVSEILNTIDRSTTLYDKEGNIIYAELIFDGEGALTKGPEGCGRIAEFLAGYLYSGVAAYSQRVQEFIKYVAYIGLKCSRSQQKGETYGAIDRLEKKLKEVSVSSEHDVQHDKKRQEKLTLRRDQNKKKSTYKTGTLLAFYENMRQSVGPHVDEELQILIDFYAEEFSRHTFPPVELFSKN